MTILVIHNRSVQRYFFDFLLENKDSVVVRLLLRSSLSLAGLSLTRLSLTGWTLGLLILGLRILRLLIGGLSRWTLRFLILTL